MFYPLLWLLHLSIDYHRDNNQFPFISVGSHNNSKQLSQSMYLLFTTTTATRALLYILVY